MTVRVCSIHVARAMPSSKLWGGGERFLVGRFPSGKVVSGWVFLVPMYLRMYLSDINHVALLLLLLVSDHLSDGMCFEESSLYASSGYN